MNYVAIEGRMPLNGCRIVPKQVNKTNSGLLCPEKVDPQQFSAQGNLCVLVA
jgi:hypothetical protein